MSEVMMVKIFIGALSVTGTLIGSSILCRKYRKLCDTFLYDEERAKYIHGRVKLYQWLILTSLVYGLFEVLTLGKSYGVVPYTAAIAGIFSAIINCITAIVKGIIAAHYVNAEIFTNPQRFKKGMIRMFIVESLPVAALILYIIGWTI